MSWLWKRTFQVQLVFQLGNDTNIHKIAKLPQIQYLFFFFFFFFILILYSLYNHRPTYHFVQFLNVYFEENDFSVYLNFHINLLEDKGSYVTTTIKLNIPTKHTTTINHTVQILLHLRLLFCNNLWYLAPLQLTKNLTHYWSKLSSPTKATRVPMIMNNQLQWTSLSISNKLIISQFVLDSNSLVVPSYILEAHRNKLGQPYGARSRLVDVVTSNGEWLHHPSIYLKFNKLMFLSLQSTITRL